MEDTYTVERRKLYVRAFIANKGVDEVLMLGKIQPFEEKEEGNGKEKEGMQRGREDRG